MKREAEEKVLAANQRFYSALETLDLEAMEGIWLHEDWVGCVHPGWELLEGWEAVGESWRRIFENTERMKVGIAEVTVRVEGETAWVNCVEQVTSSYSSGFSTAWVQATNIFVRRNGDWRLVHHHASPIPHAEDETVQ
ncbi:MAG: nuclear transport factor 2 family protein [Terriglobales bacterium]